MMTTAITAETITNRQIRNLRQEALAAVSPDYAQADICARALSDDTVDQDGNLVPYADWTLEEARQACADAVNAARAMDDSQAVSS